MELGHRSIVRGDNHFVSGDDGVWVLIDGPLYAALCQGSEGVVRLPVFGELSPLSESECVDLTGFCDWQEWGRCKWHPGSALTRHRLGRHMGVPPGEYPDASVDWIWKHIWQAEVVRPRLRRGWRLLPDGRLPERTPRPG